MICDLELDHSWLSCRAEHPQLSSSSWEAAAVGSWLHGQAAQVSGGNPLVGWGYWRRPVRVWKVVAGDCSISALEQVSHRGAAPCRSHQGAGAGGL